MIEIERKFLVENDDFKHEAFDSYKIVQGFLNSNKERTVRVRLLKKKGFLTVKGISSEDGLERFEWEIEINPLEAEQLLKLCENPTIKKKRYLIKSGDHIIEVDVFQGENEGLTLAEIELSNKHENFSKPQWLGKEVTGKKQYYNSNLINQPYKNW